MRPKGLKPRQIAGQRVTPEAARQALYISRWAIGFARKIERLSEPGVYDIKLVVTSDGRKMLDFGGNKEVIKD